MPTETIAGRLVDENGSPLADLVVAAYGLALYARPLANTTTTQNGDFTLTYNRGIADGVYVNVFDGVKRVLYESPLYDDINDPVTGLPATITLNRADVTGWLVTLSTGAPQKLSTTNLVTPIIDNAEAWRALTQTVQEAQGSLRFLIHYFDVERIIVQFDPPYEPLPGKLVPIGFVGTPATGHRLEDEILLANRAPRNVWVWIVINDFPLPLADTAGAVEDYFKKQNDQDPHTVKVARFKVPQVTPMHAKIVVAGQAGGRYKALIPASGLIQEYFDGQAHVIYDPRRGEFNYTNVIEVPVHDVSVSIGGPAVNDLDETIRLYWDDLNPASPMPPIPASSPAGTDPVQIVRTIPANRFTSIPTKGETGILEAYQRAFSEADSYIYIETQYLVESAIGDSLFLALKRKSNLQLIVALNNNVDVPRYLSWQTSLLQKLQRALETIGAGDRLGIFTLWTHEQLSDGGPAKDYMVRNYIHSKSAIVDDNWATIGSANLEGTGLNRAQHIGAFPPFLFNISRGTEVNAVIYNGVGGQPASQTPNQLRRMLWAEHLGFKDGAGNINPTAPELMTKPAAGWLDLWRTRAAERVAALKAAPPTLHPARILPWVAEKDPTDYLDTLGIDTKTIEVLEKVPQFKLSTGQWK
jgi:phosphatidylserine/phosphatidylglycerophosphate/cardiolipin synthase-like enzyme